MALALVVSLANIGSFIVDLAAMGLSLKENNTSKVKTRFEAAEEELMESKKILNEYFCVMNEKERRGFNRKYNQWVSLVPLMRCSQCLILFAFSGSSKILNSKRPQRGRKLGGLSEEASINSRRMWQQSSWTLVVILGFMSR